MTVNLVYPSGATPLDADELASLIPGHINTQDELNEWEQLNIIQGENWARKQRKEILKEAFVRQLNKHMFGETWKWAGEFRKSDKSIGVDWLTIGVELKKLLDDAHYQIEYASKPPTRVTSRLCSPSPAANRHNPSWTNPAPSASCPRAHPRRR